MQLEEQEQHQIEMSNLIIPIDTSIEEEEEHMPAIPQPEKMSGVQKAHLRILSDDFRTEIHLAS